MSLDIAKLYSKFVKYPFGKTLFSYAFSFQAPYFLTIRPIVKDLQPGLAVVAMKQRWGVQNHIKTVHAIAVCNLVEMAMGLVAEVSIPPHLRWLPMGMNIDYLKKATGTLTATTKINPDTFFILDKYPGEVQVPVDVSNSEGVVVTTAKVKLWISGFAKERKPFHFPFVSRFFSTNGRKSSTNVRTPANTALIINENQISATLNGLTARLESDRERRHEDGLRIECREKRAREEEDRKAFLFYQQHHGENFRIFQNNRRREEDDDDEGRDHHRDNNNN
eukprot:gene17400-24048_t